MARRQPLKNSCHRARDHRGKKKEAKFNNTLINCPWTRCCVSPMVLVLLCTVMKVVTSGAKFDSKSSDARQELTIHALLMLILLLL